MATLRSLTLYTAGIATGLALVLACGDGTGAVDAAVDAGKAPYEPPITAARYYRVRFAGGPLVAPTRPTEVNNAACHAGDILITGGCYAYYQGMADPPLSGGDVNDVVLVESGPDRNVDGSGNVTPREGWLCKWANPNARVGVMLEVEATCFKPAP